MPRVVRRFRGDVRRLFDRSVLHLRSLLDRSDRHEAVDPELAFFTQAEYDQVEAVIQLFLDKLEITVPR